MISLITGGQGERETNDVLASLFKGMLGTSKTLRSAFRKMDLNGDGFLDEAELSTFLRKCRISVPSGKLHHIFTTLDKVCVLGGRGRGGGGEREIIRRGRRDLTSITNAAQSYRTSRARFRSRM